MSSFVSRGLRASSARSSTARCGSESDATAAAAAPGAVEGSAASRVRSVTAVAPGSPTMPSSPAAAAKPRGGGGGAARAERADGDSGAGMACPGGRARGRAVRDAKRVVARLRGHRPAGPGDGARARARATACQSDAAARRDASRVGPIASDGDTPRRPRLGFFANGHERAGNASRAFPGASVPAESGRALSAARGRALRAPRSARVARTRLARPFSYARKTTIVNSKFRIRISTRPEAEANEVELDGSVFVF